MEKSTKPQNWPSVLLVWDNGGEWDGISVDPDDDPEYYLQKWLDDIGDSSLSGEEMLSQDCWARVGWDETRGGYRRERFERADGTPTQYERFYAPDDISFLNVNYK